MKNDAEIHRSSPQRLHKEQRSQNQTEIIRKLVHARSKCSINKSKGTRSGSLKNLLDKVERFQKYRNRIPIPSLLL